MAAQSDQVGSALHRGIRARRARRVHKTLAICASCSAVAWSDSGLTALEPARSRLSLGRSYPTRTEHRFIRRTLGRDVSASAGQYPDSLQVRGAAFVGPPALRGSKPVRRALGPEDSSSAVVAEPDDTVHAEVRKNGVPTNGVAPPIISTGHEEASKPESGPGAQQVATVFAAFLVGAAAGFGGQYLWPSGKSVKAPLDSVATTKAASDLQLQVPSSGLPSKRKEELTMMDDKLASLYTDLMEATRQAGAKLSDIMRMKTLQEKAAPSRVPPSVVKQIRGIGDILDEAQNDVYDEVWVSLETYPSILEAYIPLFNYYANTAFPDVADDAQTAINKAQRDAMNFEAQSYLQSIERLETAIKLRKVRAVEEAFAKTSLAYDRYLKAGDLYTGYDPVTSTTIFFRNVYDSQLQYTPLALETPRIRDEVLVLQGPDKGKVGRVMWLGRENAKDIRSTVLSAVVKLDPNPVLGSTPQSRGVKEVKAYPVDWIVLTRSSSQSYTRDFVLATMAAVISCGLTYPLETLKCRVQLNQSWLPPEGPLGLLNGVELNVLREAPNAGFLMAGFNFLTRQAVALPFIDGNNPNLKFLLMIPSGILAMVSGSFVKVPIVDVSKQVQSGTAKNLVEAVENVYLKPQPSEVLTKLATVFSLTIIRGVPFGAFQCLIYEVMKDKTPDLLEAVGVPIPAEPFVWGAVAGFCTGYLTNPPDVIITRMAVDQRQNSGSKDTGPAGIWGRIVAAAEDIQREEGLAGFAKGGLENAIYFAPEAMIWFGTYEALKEILCMFEL